MDDELRMKLAGLGSPETLAACIVEHYPSIEIPIPLEQLANAVGIVDIVGQTTSSFEGVLVTTAAKRTGSIAYNNASRIERRRFTIAHEIGHFLIPWHDASAQCASADMAVFKSQDVRKNKEAEANRFAAALLTPPTLFVPDIRRFGSPETEHVLALATKYRVSKEMAARRYTELCDHVCAVVFSHRSVVRIFPEIANLSPPRHHHGQSFAGRLALGARSGSAGISVRVDRDRARNLVRSCLLAVGARGLRAIS